MSFSFLKIVKDVVSTSYASWKARTYNAVLGANAAYTVYQYAVKGATPAFIAENAPTTGLIIVPFSLRFFSTFLVYTQQPYLVTGGLVLDAVGRGIFRFEYAVMDFIFKPLEVLINGKGIPASTDNLMEGSATNFTAGLEAMKDPRFSWTEPGKAAKLLYEFNYTKCLPAVEKIVEKLGEE